jgi:hypothetical protein
MDKKTNKILILLVIILAFTAACFAFNKKVESPAQISEQKEIQNTTTPIAPTPVTPVKKVTPIKETYVYHRNTCWGNPPYNYAELRQQENDTISKLKEKYRVTVIECDPRIQ